MGLLALSATGLHATHLETGGVVEFVEFIKTMLVKSCVSPLVTIEMLSVHLELFPISKHSKWFMTH